MERHLNRLRQTTLHGSTVTYFKHWTPSRIIQSFCFILSNIYDWRQNSTWWPDDLFNSNKSSVRIEREPRFRGEALNLRNIIQLVTITHLRMWDRSFRMSISLIADFAASETSPWVMVTGRVILSLWIAKLQRGQMVVSWTNRRHR